MARTAQDDPAPLTEDAAQILTNIAKVRGAKQEPFKADLRMFFELAKEWHQFDLNAPKRTALAEQLFKVEKQALKLMQQLEKLDDNARKALGVSTVRVKMFSTEQTIEEHDHQTADLYEVGDGMAQGHFLIAHCFRTIDMLRIGAQTYGRPVPKKPGRPRTVPRDRHGGYARAKAADIWMVSIFHCVERHGGRLTLDKNQGTGTLIEFIEVAMAYLPHKFRLGGPARLQRIKKQIAGLQSPQK